MKSIISSLCAAAILASFAFPASAASVPAPRVAPAVQTNVEQVQYYGGHNGYYRGYHSGWQGRQHWRGDRWRGDRYHRRNRDFAAPGAFIAGAIIGGALAAQPQQRYYVDRAPRRVYRDGGNAHVGWCYDRYRSYRASDNTFQPYNGPRRQCRSPYY